MPEFALVAQNNCVPPDVLAFIAAAVNLQNRQRQRSPLRTRAISFSQQAILIGTAA